MKTLTGWKKWLKNGVLVVVAYIAMQFVEAFVYSNILAYFGISLII
jgi:hypothetical protein